MLQSSTLIMKHKGLINEQRIADISYTDRVHVCRPFAMAQFLTMACIRYLWLYWEVSEMEVE